MTKEAVTMGALRRTTTLMAAVAAVGLVPAATAAAATRPAARTGGAAQVTIQSARLTGSVNPNGRRTSYVFQWGPTATYGSQTPSQDAGGGTRGVHAAAELVGLAAATTYHYRLVARNAAGATYGGDRTFTTRVQPLGFLVAATPNPVPFGAATVVGGALGGTGAGNREIVLQFNPFPYTGGFQQLGGPLRTTQAGTFAFPATGVGINTQLRVVTTGSPRVVSSVLNVGVAVRVSTHILRTHVRRGSVVRFWGSVKPARVAAQVGVQRLTRDGRWVTFAGTITHHQSAQSSRYAKRVRITRSGSYRIYVLVNDGQYVPGTGRVVKLKVR